MFEICRAQLPFFSHAIWIIRAQSRLCADPLPQERFDGHFFYSGE
jgi:hypothetical protein